MANPKSHIFPCRSNITFSLYQMAVILNFWVEMMSNIQTDVIIGILVVDLSEKVYSYMILGALVQKLIFQDGASGHLGSTLAKNVGIFLRDLGLNTL
jgi:hypothetical protein